MERRELLRINKYMLLLIGLLFSCERQEQSYVSIPKIYVKISDSNLSIKQGTVGYKGKLFSGYLFALYPSGDTALCTSYYNGKEFGLQRKWHTNKQLAEVRFFENGNKTGEHSAWWESGNKKFLLHYKNDLFEGNQKEWNDKGILYRDGNYVNGHEEGSQKFWRPDGRLYANYVVRSGRNYGLTGVKNCENVGDSIQK